MSITLYPAVDIRDGRAVRLTQGRADEETVYDADPVAAAKRFTDAGSPWLHVVDLDAAFTGEPRNRALIASIIEQTGAKVQASGGVRTLDDVRTCVGFGAQRVVIGTMALTNPAFVQEVLDELGPVMAVGLDVRGDVLQARGWTEEAGNLWEALEAFTAMGVPRFVVTDVATDGMLQGPNTQLLARVAEATDAWVTASGGVATLDDLRALNDLHPRVDAAIVGKALYAEQFTIEQALAACAEGGDEGRPESEIEGRTHPERVTGGPGA
jgi:phosphoribosylanthranilate isomerase